MSIEKYVCGSVVLGALGCSNGNATNAPSVCTASYDAIYAASDYSSSTIGGCDVDGGRESPFSGADLGADPALTVAGGRAFFIARNSPERIGLIFELDPRCGAPFAKYSANEPGHVASDNPQDVAVTAGGDLWIPRFNIPSLLILDAQGNRKATLDLSALDADGNPNMSAIRTAQIGGVEKAFIAVEELDDASKPAFQSTRPSLITRVDVATVTVEATTKLAGRDPFGLIAEANGAYFFAAPGNFDIADEKDAGIERFDPQTFTTTYLLGEANLGASVTEVAVNGSCGVAIVADPTHAVNATSLITFDADHGVALTTAKNPLLATAGFDLSGLAWKGNVLVVGDRRAAAGGKYPVHVFDRSNACDLAARPDTIFLSQKPIAVRTTVP